MVIICFENSHQTSWAKHTGSARAQQSSSESQELRAYSWCPCSPSFCKTYWFAIIMIYSIYSPGPLSWLWSTSCTRLSPWSSKQQGTPYSPGPGSPTRKFTPPKSNSNQQYQVVITVHHHHQNHHHISSSSISSSSKSLIFNYQQGHYLSPSSQAIPVTVKSSPVCQVSFSFHLFTTISLLSFQCIFITSIWIVMTNKSGQCKCP